MRESEQLPMPVSRPTYAEARRDFRWSENLAALGWAPGASVSLGETILDRHAGSGRTALRWFGKDGSERRLNFDELSRLSHRVANLLRALGVEPGDRVAGYLPRVPETLAIMIGAWKAGAVYVPVFTGFGPDAIAYRMEHSGAKVLCTHREFRRQLPPGLGGRPRIATVAAGGDAEPGDVAFESAMAEQSERFEPSRFQRDEPAVLLYTSGSTGPPKGVQIAANFPLAIHPYMVHGVDLRPGDVFWPTGDPGWGYGLVCYMVALAMGVAVTSQEAAPTPASCLDRLADLGVTNLATTPTLLRGVMALGADAVRRHPVRIRAVSSCGEPLNAEVVAFFHDVWGVTVMDQYGSSEFGMPIGNLNAVDMAVKPGSMGLPMPGAAMAVVDDDGREAPADTVGHIAMKPTRRATTRSATGATPSARGSCREAAGSPSATWRAATPTATSGSRAAPTM